METAFVIVLLALETYLLATRRWVLGFAPPVFALLFAGLSFSREAPFSLYSPLYYLSFVAYCLFLHLLLHLWRGRKK